MGGLFGTRTRRPWEGKDFQFREGTLAGMFWGLLQAKLEFRLWGFQSECAEPPRISEVGLAQSSLIPT